MSESVCDLSMTNIVPEDRYKLDYIHTSWPVFPLHEIYYSSPSDYITEKSYEEGFFLFITQKVKDIVPMYLSNVQSKFFRVYEFQVLGYTTPVGYAFIPRKIHKPWVIRYTPYIVSVTNPSMTAKKVETSIRTSIFSTDYIELLELSCGCEVLQNLSSVMGVNLTN